MECACESENKYKTRYQNLRKKYEHARKHNKKLLGVAMELTQVLEEYVRGDRIPNVTETMVLCANIYPSLFHELNARTKELEMEIEDIKSEDKEETNVEDKLEVADCPTHKDEENEEEEYSEGFMSRPKLPRTPQYAST